MIFSVVFMGVKIVVPHWGKNTEENLDEAGESN
jgi:hypothetical protein